MTTTDSVFQGALSNMLTEIFDRPMRRPNVAPLAVALVSGLLVWLVQDVLRPLTAPESLARWLLGPAPNFLVGAGFPFVGLVGPDQSLRTARRAVGHWTLLALGALLTMEAWRPIAGARTFDVLDLAASALGAATGWALARRLAPRWAAVPVATGPRDA
jgi:hypothetical protein